MNNVLAAWVCVWVGAARGRGAGGRRLVGLSASLVPSALAASRERWWKREQAYGLAKGRGEGRTGSQAANRM